MNITEEEAVIIMEETLTQLITLLDSGDLTEEQAGDVFFSSDIVICFLTADVENLKKNVRNIFLKQ